jgi:hypothetical protein
MRRRRWAALAAVVLVSSYPISNGPAFYFLARGWLPYRVYHAVYGPLNHILGEDGLDSETYAAYTAWWMLWALKHEAPDAPVNPPPLPGL